MLTPEQCAEIKARWAVATPGPWWYDRQPTDVAALLATVEALRSELDEAVKVLRDLEWVRRDWGGSSGFECPCCGAHDYLDKEEHEDGCDLAVFLARHKEARP